MYEDLYKVRNVKPGLKWGMWAGTLHGGVHMWLNDLGLGALVPWTLRHDKPDHAIAASPRREMPRIDYPKYDGVLTFDKLSSVFVSNTNHEEDQPVAPAAARRRRFRSTINLALYDGPGGALLPGRRLRVRRRRRQAERTSGCRSTPQNCVHCKTCDIKDPLQNIHWVTPEGGGGRTIPNM